MRNLIRRLKIEIGLSPEGRRPPNKRIKITHRSSEQIFDKKKMKIFYFCGRCQSEAKPTCMNHRQLIEIIRGSEINKIIGRRRLECQKCFRINFTSKKNYNCSKCKYSMHKCV